MKLINKLMNCLVGLASTLTGSFETVTEEKKEYRESELTRSFLTMAHSLEYESVRSVRSFTFPHTKQSSSSLGTSKVISEESSLLLADAL